MTGFWMCLPWVLRSSRSRFPVLPSSMARCRPGWAAESTWTGPTTSALRIVPFTPTRPDGGGGIYTRLAALDIVDSTLSENHATEVGGGIYHDVGSGTVTIQDSTLSGNQATDVALAMGGGIYNVSGSMQISGSTLVGNQASSGFRSLGGWPIQC